MARYIVSHACLPTWKYTVTLSEATRTPKFKAVNNRDRNFTVAKMKRRKEQIEKSVARYLDQDSTDRQEPSAALTAKTTRPPANT